MHPWAQRGDAVGPASGLRPSQVCACPFPYVPRSSELGAQQSRQTSRLRSPRSPLGTVGTGRPLCGRAQGRAVCSGLDRNKSSGNFRTSPPMVGEGREGEAPATAHQPLSLQSISSQEFPAKEATRAGPGKVSGCRGLRCGEQLPPRGEAEFPSLQLQALSPGGSWGRLPVPRPHQLVPGQRAGRGLCLYRAEETQMCLKA